MIVIIIADIFAVLSLILDLWNLDYYLQHIKLLSEDERCKYLKINRNEGVSKCTHPRHIKLFSNGLCSPTCSKRLGENVEVSTFDSLTKNNFLFIMRLIIEIIVSIILIAYTLMS